MKNLFFLALLTNLMFFLWQYHAGAFRHVADKPEFVNPNPKQIWLVSELEKKPSVTVAAIQASPGKTTLTAPAAVISHPEKNNSPQTVVAPLANAASATVTSTTPVTPAVKTLYCYQIKGFADKATATRWSQKQSTDASSVQFKEIPPVVSAYVVNYPAAATFADSKKNVAALKAHGVNSFFMINHGEFKGVISLGVFKNEARAMKAQQMLVKKGINAKVSKRYKTTATVSAQIKTEQTRPQLLATLTKYARHPSIELLSKCE